MKIKRYPNEGRKSWEYTTSYYLNPSPGVRNFLGVPTYLLNMTNPGRPLPIYWMTSFISYHPKV